MNVHEIIDQAIDENRWRERVLVGFAILFVVLGAFVLLWGLVNDSMLAFAGVVESLLFVPAVLLIRSISRENMALRLLEIPLRKAKTAEEAANVLMRYFASAHQLVDRTDLPQQRDPS